MYFTKYFIHYLFSTQKACYVSTETSMSENQTTLSNGKNNFIFCLFEKEMYEKHDKRKFMTKCGQRAEGLLWV